MADQPLPLSEVIVTASLPKNDLTAQAANTNVLHYFRSFTHLFTISCVPSIFLQSDQSQLEQAIDNYVIAAAGGKNRTKSELDVSKPIYDNAATGTKTDKSSRFITSEDGTYLDFFIDDVEVETLADFDQQTGFSKATKLKFTITEPYSLSGFLQTLQVAAEKAGYVSYISAPFIFRINFVGYPDWEDISAEAIKIEPATRFFIFRFTEVSARVDESGTRYHCSTVPLNELAFGVANKLTNSITVQGNTVGEILKDLFVKLNYRTQHWMYAGLQFDKYEIQFPQVDSYGDIIIGGSENTKITNSRVGNPDEDNVNYAYENPAVISASPSPQELYKAKIISTTFSANANIHDIIAGIMRDSEYITNIFRKELKDAIDEYDMLDYFNVVTSVIPIGWNTLNNKPTYNYIFKVVPHKMHYSRIPKYQNLNINTKKARSRVRRSYNYLFTGKNLDILRFEINYNYLYYQSQTNNEGLNPVDSGSHAAASGDLSVSPHLGNFQTREEIKKIGGYVASIAFDPQNVNISSAGQNTRRGIEKNPFNALAKNFHKAILDNVGQSQLEIEILGDPYFLSQQGMVNFTSQNTDAGNEFAGMNSFGEMSYQTGEIFVEVKFRNPTDINKDTGIMDFSDDVTSYSGIYRLKQVVSKFNNGSFTQTLKLIKLEKQSDNLVEPIRPDGGVLEDINQTNITVRNLVTGFISKWYIPRNN